MQDPNPYSDRICAFCRLTPKTALSFFKNRHFQPIIPLQRYLTFVIVAGLFGCQFEGCGRKRRVRRKSGRKGKGRLSVWVLLILCALAGCSGSDAPKSVLHSADQMNSPAYTIGVGQGTAAMTVVEKNFPRCKIEYYASLTDGYLGVKYGKLDAFAFDRHTLKYVTVQNPDLALLDDKIGDEQIVVGAQPGREELMQKVNAFIRQYRQDGTYQAMYERWILGKNLQMPDLPEPDRPAPALTVGTDGRNEPMNYYADGRLSGFDIEFAKRLALFLNARITFQSIEYPAIVAAAAAGKIDLLIANLNATEERRKIMLFSDPYVDSEVSFLVRKDRLPVRPSGRITQISQLAGKKVGVQTGTTYENVLKTAVPKAIPSYFTTFTDQIEAVKTGRIAGFLVDEVVARGMVRETSGLSYIPQWLYTNEYAFAFSKKSSELQKQVNTVLEQMKKDQTIKKLEDKWFGADETAKALPDCRLDGPNGVIRFATNSDSAPFVYVKNGRLVGYDIEAAMIIAAKLGRRLKIIDMDFSAIIPSLVSGKTDMAGDFITITEERAKSVLFSIPYYTGGTVVVVAADPSRPVAAAVTQIAQLAGKKVGIITGSAYDAVLKNKCPGAVPEYFNNFSDQAEALKAGKIAAFLVDEPMARDIQNRTGGLATLKDLLTSDGYAFAFAKSRPDLQKDVDDALRQMQADGTLREIEARWFGTDEAARTLPALAPGGKKGVLRLATNSGMAPFVYRKDDCLVGYDIEIALRIADRLGRKLEIIDMDISAVLASLLSGKSDMAACGITVTEERARSVLFSIPNYQGGVAVMVAAPAALPEEAAAGREGFWRGLKASFERTFVKENRYRLVLQGLGVTLLISVLSAVFGTILGFGICVLRRAPSRLANIPAKVYIRAIQGTPIVVLLMILYYIVFGSVDIDAILVAVIGFSLNFAAYISEMMRTGIDAVDQGQHEAACALGFSRIQVFAKITFPQAARHVLPVFKGEFISMLKMTSVVGYIAIQDLTKMSDIIRSRTYEAFFPLIATAVIYFVVAYALVWLLGRVEIRVDPKRRPRSVRGVKNA